MFTARSPRDPRCRVTIQTRLAINPVYAEALFRCLLADRRRSVCPASPTAQRCPHERSKYANQQQPFDHSPHSSSAKTAPHLSRIIVQTDQSRGPGFYTFRVREARQARDCTVGTRASVLRSLCLECFLRRLYTLAHCSRIDETSCRSRARSPAQLSIRRRG